MELNVRKRGLYRQYLALGLDPPRNTTFYRRLRAIQNQNQINLNQISGAHTSNVEGIFNICCCK
jgi:hypothetical protein